MSLAVRRISPDRQTTLSLPVEMDVSAVDAFLPQLDGVSRVQPQCVYVDFRDTANVDRCGLNLLKMARRQFGKRCALQAINLNNKARQCLYKLGASDIIDWR